jgi:hypothetical protein
MCGIAGFISRDALGPEASVLGSRLLGGMRPRGLDGEEFFAARNGWLSIVSQRLLRNTSFPLGIINVLGIQPHLT